MAGSWRKGKLMKAAVAGSVVGIAGGATAYADATSPDTTPVETDGTVSLDLEDGMVAVEVDDEVADVLDATIDSPDSESVATPPGVETPASPQSADSPEEVDSPANVADDDSPQGVQNQNDDQDSPEGDDESSDSD